MSHVTFFLSWATKSVWCAASASVMHGGTVRYDDFRCLMAVREMLQLPQLGSLRVGQGRVNR